MNISDIFCNGNLVNVQTWEVLPPGETGFNRATLRVHFFLDFLFYVPLNTDIMSHFVTNRSSIQQRMRSFTPVVVDSFSRTPIQHPLLYVNVDSENEKNILYAL